jgi:hypothetical protein
LGAFSDAAMMHVAGRITDHREIERQPALARVFS